MPKTSHAELTKLIPETPADCRFVFQPVKSSDAAVLVRHLRDIRITRYTYIPHPYTVSHARQFVRRAQRLRRLGKGVILNIVDRESNQIIGAIGVMSIDWTNRKTEFGYWLAREYWGKGVMTEATRLFVKYAFETLKLERLYAHVFSPNIASQRVVEKIGFRLEGIIRRANLHRGRWLDSHLYSMLRSEYLTSVRGK
ncbi:MAG: GNAT family N-acetyltransferase [Candidatus Zixiibacteriota bacterium]